MIQLFLLVLAAMASSGACDEGGGAAAARASKVYCSGALLDAVQRAGLFADSKHFVDMPMRADPEDVLKAFEVLPADRQRDAGALRAFVEQYFDEPGAELVPHRPEDFPPASPLASGVRDPALREFAQALHELWPTLCREVGPQVSAAPHRSSAIPRRWPVVLPGGRFRETYYWDSFWIVEGLLASGLLQTARGLVQNLLDDVQAFGFVPNGGRVYYLNRSQPPLLCEMVASVARALGAEAATAWMASSAPLLQKELAWWSSGDHLVQLPGGRRLNRYYASWEAPRPESYREDLETAAGDAAVYREIATGAETGWDFSCRWGRQGGRTDGGKFQLRDMSVTKVLPVDLNAILYKAELTLAAILEAVASGSTLAQAEQAVSAGSLSDGSARALAEAASRRREAMDELMWHATLGRWVDAWLPEEGEATPAAVAAEAKARAPTLADFAAPLWAGLADEARAPAVLKALGASGLLGAAGAATTARETGQQWDAPNAWPPLQAMLVEGLRPLGGDGEALAADLAQRWVGTCYQAWRNTGFMHEKYNAFSFGSGGAGGEYEPQVGFGWSNGVALQLLRDYGGLLRAPQGDGAPERGSPGGGIQI